jgi:hypothetical protein
MQEALLQYIWKNSLFIKEKYKSDTEESVTIIDPGSYNTDGGPDFTNAKVKINDTLWAGNIEIHLRASDWYKHNHHVDQAYNNVILHVVSQIDKSCFNSAGRQICCIEIKCDRNIEKKYLHLLASASDIPCHESLSSLNSSLISFWLSSLTVERLQSKISQIHDLLATTRNSWEEAFYILTAYSFGLKINALPFELMAKSIPLKILSNHTGNLMQLEALFYGQAGFLEGETKDEYHSKLQKEYQFFKKKYNLQSIENHLWKFMRLRPKNFPTIRIAQFCSLIHHSNRLFSRTMECEEPGELISLYNCTVSEYWQNHYTFGKISASKLKSLGKATINSIIINTIVPFLFIYGENKNNPLIKEKAIRLLELLPPENNHITRRWSKYSVVCRNAAESQALIQLTNRYCIGKRCIDCQIGHLILRG